MPELAKAYEPQKYEDNIYKHWEESGFFDPDKCVAENITTDNAEYFSMVLPPPNVTGTLHMGHAVMLAVQDVMTRYHRMKGDKTLWIPGTDHAAIATQAKVEKLLIEKEGMKNPRAELGRENFLKRVEEYAQESHDTIVNQCRKMGASVDWGREAYTLDEERNLAVRTVFKKMYDDGLIYRGYRLVNWCPHCHSTLADDEVEYKEENGKFYRIKYGPFILATSRPETKLGDTAVAVHPDDARYKDMVGKKYMIPGVLGEFEVEVVADEAVDPNFGTGAVKVTPAHSFTDNEIALRHHLPSKQIIDEDGRMMGNCGKYAGMTTKEARAAIVADMQKMGLIDHIEENYKHNLGVCYRCGAVVEPLPSKQWFVNVNKEFTFHQSAMHPITGLEDGELVTLKKLMQQVVNNKQIEIIPDRFNKVYFNWVDNLRDWCISRQIWFGHQIPVWYKNEEIYVGVEAPTGEGWVRDPDTLDTWFSSGLWTFSALDWPSVNNFVKHYHPTSVLETGYDIIFFWVARMILMTTYTLGEIPFKKVYLHGLVRDEQGRKMSKSLGNVMDPLEMINKYGADATRLSLLLGNTPGNDTKLSEEKVEGFRNFTNKLWNISRFMLLNIATPVVAAPRPEPKTAADEWILSKLDTIIEFTTLNLEKFNFSYAGESLRDFTWGDLADWYLEVAKVEGNKMELLNYLLNTVLKLWHPFMPFVTEEIWREIYGREQMLLVQKWPVMHGVTVINADEKEMNLWGRIKDVFQTRDNPETIERATDFELIKNVITGIRSIRAENKIEPIKKLSAIIGAGDREELLQQNLGIIKSLARLEKIQVNQSVGKPVNFAVFITGKVEVFVDLSGTVDVTKEKERLSKEIEQTQKYLDGLEKKLSNAEFVKNAPSEVIDKEKTKLSEAKEKMEKLNKQSVNLI